VSKYLDILAAAQRMVRQVPAERMDDRVIVNRPRTIRPFCYRIFRCERNSFALRHELRPGCV